MRYLLYNNRTRESFYFGSRRELHKWIKSHFRLMSYRTMSCWSLCNYQVYEYEMSLPDAVRFTAVLRSHIADLPDYILSFLK